MLPACQERPFGWCLRDPWGHWHSWALVCQALRTAPCGHGHLPVTLRETLRPRVRPTPSEPPSGEEVAMSEPRVEVSPFSKGQGLSGFVVSGRWPSSTREWAQFLALAVRLAAVPGMVATTTVFRAVEDVPDDPQPDTVGLVTAAGPVLGEGALEPGQFSAHTPPALLLLHPPEESRPS